MVDWQLQLRCQDQSRSNTQVSGGQSRTCTFILEGIGKVLDMVRILERATRVGKAQEAQEGQVACGSSPKVLVHVHGNLPGAMWTAAHQVCPEGVSETSSTLPGIQTSSPGHNLSTSLGAEVDSCL